MANQYQVGNLYLQLATKMGNVATTFKQVNTQLERTKNIINSLSGAFTQFAVSSKQLDTQGLYTKINSLGRIFENASQYNITAFGKSFSQVGNALRNIGNVSKLDTRGFYNKFTQMTKIIKPFVEEVVKAEKGLVALQSILQKSSRANSILKKSTLVGGGSSASSSASSGGRNLSIFATLGKWNYYINMARYYGRALSNMVQYAMDYVETQNLWQVANRNNIAQATEFIDKMSTAYGLSEATLMNYQAIFKNMLSALGGISDMLSSTLSQQITQLALDFSSLYNVPIESAMTKFQAVLSGQVRPIRSVSGYDITENTIFDIYQKAGGEKTMRQLNQLEKRLLRIYAVFGQMGETGAVGDMAKTIESASNQARIMNEQLKETLTWSGQIILMWLNNVGVFQYVNALLMTIKEIMKAIAYSLGYEEQDFLSGLMTSTKEAREAIDEIQGKLLSFDKFEALNSNQSNVLGIDQNILNLLEKINVATSDYEMKATSISKEWLKQLGFVDENGDGIYEITQEAQDSLDTLKNISIIIGAILSYGLASKLIKLIVPLKEITSLIKFASASWKNFGITAIIGTLIYLYATNEQVRDSINRIFVSLQPLLNTIGKLANAIAPIITMIAEFIATIIIVLDKAGLLEGAVWGIIIAFTAWKGMQLVNWLSGFSGTIGLLATAIKLKLAPTIMALTINWTMLNTAMKITTTIGIIALISGIVSLFNEWDNLNTGGIVASLIAITAGVVALAVALKILQNNWAGAIGVAGLVTGAGLLVTTNLDSLKKVPQYANGGFVDKGQLFVAREAGAEMVGSMGGHTAVANNDQIVQGISQGVYEATISANSQVKQNIQGNVYIDGNKVGQIVTGSVYKEGKRVGYFKG